MKFAFGLVVGLWFVPLIAAPASALDVPAVCAALDPREPSAIELREAAIATAQQQYQAGQPEAAVQTLQTLVRDLQEHIPLPRADSLLPTDAAVDHYLAIAAAAIEMEQFTPAFQWLETAFTWVDGVHYRRQYFVTANIAKLYAQAGNFERAWEITHTIPEPIVPNPGGVENANRDHGRASARRYLTQAYLAQGDFATAQATMETIEHELVQADTQVDLANYLAQHGEFEQAIALAHNITEALIRLDAQITISQAYAQASQTQPAQQRLATTTAEAVRLRSASRLIDIAQVYLDWQQPHQVRRVLRLAQDSSWSAEFNHSDHWQLLEIARLYWQLDDPKATQQLLEMALGAAATVSVGGYESDALKQAVVQFYLESNHQSLTRAVILADQISNPYRHNETLTEILEVILAQQDYPLARFAARQLSLPERVVSLIEGEPLWSEDPVEASSAPTERDRWWDFVECLEEAHR